MIIEMSRQSEKRLKLEKCQRLLELKQQLGPQLRLHQRRIFRPKDRK